MQLVGGDHIYNLPVLRGVGSGHFTSVAEKELSFYPCYEAGPFLAGSGLMFYNPTGSDGPGPVRAAFYHIL